MQGGQGRGPGKGRAERERERGMDGARREGRGGPQGRRDEKPGKWSVGKRGGDVMFVTAAVFQPETSPLNFDAL